MLFLARAAQAPVVIAHNSSAGTVALIAEARNRGQVAFSETAPQYLLLDNTLYEGSEPWRYILQPPLREPKEKDTLWERISEGLVDMIITDHCDYTKKQKMAVDDFTKTPGGLPGMETLLPLMVTYGVGEDRSHWTDLARLLAANPPQIYGLWPRKGALLPGSDADLVLYDRRARRHSRRIRSIHSADTHLTKGCRSKDASLPRFGAVSSWYAMGPSSAKRAAGSSSPASPCTGSSPAQPDGMDTLLISLLLIAGVLLGAALAYFLLRGQQKAAEQALRKELAKTYEAKTQTAQSRTVQTYESRTPPLQEAHLAELQRARKESTIRAARSSRARWRSRSRPPAGLQLLAATHASWGIRSITWSSTATAISKITARMPWKLSS